MLVTSGACAALAIMAALWMPYSTWETVTNGLLVFLGLLVAALVQVIPVTANFLQADSLTPDEARRLTKALEAQQRYWLGLLAAAAATCVALIVGLVVGKSDVSLPITIGSFTKTIKLSSVVSGAIAAMLSLVFIKTVGFFPGVLSLQRLRAQLVIDAAKRRVAEKVESAAAEASSKTINPTFVPPDYGRIVRPPH